MPKSHANNTTNKVALIPWFRRPNVAAIVCALLAVLLYSPALFHDFTYDDAGVIVDDDRLEDPLFGFKAWVSPWWKHGTAKMESRPLTSFTLWAQVQVHGKTPMPFHAVNIALFGLLCAQVCLLSWRWLGGAWGGWGAGLLFACHPIHVEVVANVVGRAEVLSAVFIVLAIQLWMRWRMQMTHKRAALVGLVVLLAGLSKESGYLVAPILGVIEVGMRRAEGRAVFARPIPWNFIAVVAIVAGLAVTQRTIMLEVAPPWRGVVSDLDNPLTTSSASERTVTPVKVVGNVTRLMVFPLDVDRRVQPSLSETEMFDPVAAGRARSTAPKTWRFWLWEWHSAQSPDYSPRMLMPTNRLTEPLVMLGLLAIGAWIAGTVWAWRRRSTVLGALLAMPITWAIPSNTLITIGTIFGERLATQLSIFVPIALMGLLRPERLGERGTKFAVAALMLIVSGFAMMTHNYRSVWRNTETLTTYMVLRHPQSGRFQAFISRELMFVGLMMPKEDTRREQAFRLATYHAEKSKEYWPRQGIGNMVLGVIAYERGDKETARRLLHESVKSDPRIGLADEYLAKIEGGPTPDELMKLRAQLEAELERTPGDKDVMRRLGMVLVKMKLPAHAAEYFEQVYSPAEDDVELIDAYLQARLLMSQWARATDLYQHLIRLTPARWSQYSDAAIVATYAGGDYLSLAKQWADQALRMNPRAPEAHAALGQWHQVVGNTAEAEKLYLEAIRMAPPDDPKLEHYKLMLERLRSMDTNR